jgi:hypothetical protein
MVRLELPTAWSDVFEFAVALMLVTLGVRSVRQAALQGSGGPVRQHRHGRQVHTHAATPAHVHLGGWTFARRPLLIGAVHGLAGSGALTALVLATLPTAAAQLAYVVLFGVGSTLGMALMSGALGWPIARAGRHDAVARAISLLVGGISVALGVWWGWPLVGRVF